jgi:hypothetical protein
MRLELE